MLERLFTSKARVKILSLLMFNQDSEFHLREIARLIKTTPTYVSKELDNLAKLNLVKKTKIANLSIYSINKDCVLLKELKAMFLKTDYLGELIRKELYNKAKYCFIYGSFASGTETKSSDIDIFVISEINGDKLIKIIQKLEGIATREINYILWDEKTFKKRAKDHHLLKTIKESKIIMLIGDKDEFKKQIR